MSETEYKPRKRWWGFVDTDGTRYLMRYHHVLAAFSDSKILFARYQTITDKRGVQFAIKHFKSSL